jgi:hypothetical protein
MSHNEIAKKCQSFLEQKGFVVELSLQTAIYDFSQVVADMSVLTYQMSGEELQKWFANYVWNRSWTDKELQATLAKQGKNLK